MPDGQVRLDADASYGDDLVTAPAPAPSQQPEEGTLPVEGQAQELVSGATLDQDANYAEGQAEPAGNEPEPEEDWNALGGRIKSKQDAIEHIKKLDRVRTQRDNEIAEMKRELAAMRAHQMETSSAAMRALQNRPSPQVQQPRQTTPLITEKQVRKAFEEGNPDAYDIQNAFIRQQNDISARAMLSVAERKMQAALEPLQRQLQEKAAALDELVGGAEQQRWESSRSEANQYINESLPPDLPEDVADAIQGRLREITSDENMMLRFMDLTPSGNVKSVNFKAMAQMVIGEYAPYIYGRRQEANATNAPTQEPKFNKAALTSSLQPSKRGQAMPSSQRKLTADQEQRVRLSQSSGQPII